MGDEVLKPERSATFEDMHGTATCLGGQRIETSHGTVEIVDAPGILTMLAINPVPADSRVCILVYGPGEPAGVGMIAQLDPGNARTVDASLLRLADQLDPMRPS